MLNRNAIGWCDYERQCASSRGGGNRPVWNCGAAAVSNHRCVLQFLLFGAVIFSCCRKRFFFSEMPMYTTAQNSFVQMPPSASTSPAVPHGMSDNFPSGNVRFQTPYSMMSGGTSGLMDSNFNVGSAMMTGVPLGYVPRAVPASHLEPNTALREEEDDAEENTAAQRAGMLYSDMKQLGVSGEHQAMMECQDQQPFLAAEDEVDRRSVFVGNVGQKSGGHDQSNRVCIHRLITEQLLLSFKNTSRTAEL